MEVTTILVALNKAKELGYRNIVVNSDNSSCVNALIDGETKNPIHERFIEDILMLRMISPFVPSFLFLENKTLLFIN